MVEHHGGQLHLHLHRHDAQRHRRRHARRHGGLPAGGYPVAGKLDNDDDGIPDDIETTQVPLPTTSSETWTNDQVHRYIISGKTNALSPDTDGDGLPTVSNWV